MRAEPRPRTLPRPRGGPCAVEVLPLRRRNHVLIPSPRWGGCSVRRWACWTRQRMSLARRRNAPLWSRCGPGPCHRVLGRPMPHLLLRRRWLLLREASVLRGGSVALPGEVSVPSTGSAESSTGSVLRTSVLRTSSETVRASGRTVTELVTATATVTASVAAMSGGANWIHRHWLWHHRGIEDEKKRGADDQQGVNWGRSHSARACQGESLASS